MGNLPALIAFIGDLLREKVTEQTFFDTNTSEKVVYPYMTYSVDTEWSEHQRDDGSVDIDIFDTSQSFADIIELEQLIKDNFRLMSVSQDDFVLRMDYVRSSNVPTADPLIRRRTVQMHIRVDWRK